MCVFISTTRSCPVVHSEDLKKKIKKKILFFYFYYITSSIHTHREARTFSCYGYWPPKKRKKEKEKNRYLLWIVSRPVPVICFFFPFISFKYLSAHLNITKAIKRGESFILSALICLVATTIINSWPHEVSFDFPFFFLNCKFVFNTTLCNI